MNTPPSLVGAVLLAAGSASRMGHRPKCLLELDGEPLIQRQLKAWFKAGLADVVVVLGHFEVPIQVAIKDFSVTLVQNPDPDAGQVSSLRLGLKALAPHGQAVLVGLADQPLIEASDIMAVMDAFQNRPAHTRVVQPSVDGLPGNPVIFDAAVRDDLLGGDVTMGCRQWQAAHPDQVHHWVTSNHRYRIDVDSSDDIEAFTRFTGRPLIWPAAWSGSCRSSLRASEA